MPGMLTWHKHELNRVKYWSINPARGPLILANRPLIQTKQLSRSQSRSNMFTFIPLTVRCPMHYHIKLHQLCVNG